MYGGTKPAAVLASVSAKPMQIISGVRPANRPSRHSERTGGGAAVGMHDSQTVCGGSILRRTMGKHRGRCHRLVAALHLFLVDSPSTALETLERMAGRWPTSPSCTATMLPAHSAQQLHHPKPRWLHGCAKSHIRSVAMIAICPALVSRRAHGSLAVVDPR